MDWFLYDIGLRHESVKNVNRKRCKTFNFTCAFNDGFRTAVKMFLIPYLFVCFLEQTSEFFTQTSH